MQSIRLPTGVGAFVLLLGAAGAALCCLAQQAICQPAENRVAQPAPATSTGDVAGSEFVEFPAEVLADKILGGLVGQLFGNLNGLPHEMKYIDQPGAVQHYTPGLPDGARTDDDTDLEWVYICALQRQDTFPPTPKQLVGLWKKHINRGIWCANKYARELMNLGIEPPLTGQPAINPWSDFNISGQFVCETFGLAAPAMPQTAASTAIPFIRVAVDGEPVQATQLFTAMIATAFVSEDVGKIIDAGRAALDRKSVLRTVIDDVVGWHNQYPDDWRKTRQLVKEKYTRFGGRTRDRNGYELNTAAIIAALLYGKGDFVNTMTMAFNFGWDADCNAATAGTIIGVIRGYRWMEGQGWQVKDVYRNTARDEMPQDETITRFADRILKVADKLIVRNGGQKLRRDGKSVYRIRTEQPANVYPLPDWTERFAQLRRQLRHGVEGDLLRGDPTAKARAAYLAICFDLWEPLKEQHPQPCSEALAELSRQKGLMELLWQAPEPNGQQLKAKAAAAGLRRPQ